MYYIFFIHLPADGHLGCFHILDVVNSAAKNSGVHVYFWIMFFFRYMPRSGIEILKSFISYLTIIKGGAIFQLNFPFLSFFCLKQIL